jgi:hypothetical protein
MAADAPPRPASTRAAPSGGGRGRLASLLADRDRALLAMALLAVFAVCLDVLDDPDLWWHLRLGRWILDHRAVPHGELFSYTAQGHAMVAHEWGSEVLFSLASSLGGVLTVALLMAVAGWSAFAGLALRLRRRGVGTMLTALAVALGALAAASVLGTRPQVITVALVSWTLLLAERHLARGGRLVWTLAPVALVWANLHAGVVLGLGVLVGACSLEALRRALGRAGTAPWRRIGSLAAATAVAGGLACLNPDGPGLFRYVVQTSSSERAKPITEWHAPNFADPANLGLLVLLGSFLLLLALGGRPSLRDLGLAVAGLAASLLAVRNTSLAVMLAVPAWAVMAQQVRDRVASRRAAAGGGRQAVVFGAALLAIAAALDGVSVAKAARDASDRGIARVYPSCAAAALSQVDGVRVFAPYFHSGYLVDRLWPDGRVFLYGESVSLGTAVFDDYGRVLGGGPRALQVLAAYGTNAVITGPGALGTTLASASSWRSVLDDRSGLRLFVTQELASRLRAPRSCA